MPAKLETQIDRFVLRSASAAVSCAAAGWNSNMSANIWLCVIQQPEGEDGTLRGVMVSVVHHELLFILRSWLMSLLVSYGPSHYTVGF